LALWILDDALDLDAGELATGVGTPRTHGRPQVAPTYRHRHRPCHCPPHRHCHRHRPCHCPRHRHRHLHRTPLLRFPSSPWFLLTDGFCFCSTLPPRHPNDSGWRRRREDRIYPQPSPHR
jgi:hypothetical protein